MSFNHVFLVTRTNNYVLPMTSYVLSWSMCGGKALVKPVSKKLTMVLEITNEPHTRALPLGNSLGAKTTYGTGMSTATWCVWWWWTSNDGYLSELLLLLGMPLRTAYRMKAYSCVSRHGVSGGMCLFFKRKVSQPLRLDNNFVFLLIHTKVTNRYWISKHSHYQF